MESKSEAKRAIAAVKEAPLVAAYNAPTDDGVLRIGFSSERGLTQHGSTTQGEHATAYALYVEFVLSMVNEEVSSNVGRGEFHTSGFVSSVIGRARRDRALLQEFGLAENPESADAYRAFLKIRANIETLKQEGDAQLRPLYEQRGILRDAKVGVLGNDTLAPEVRRIEEIDEGVFTGAIEEVRKGHFVNCAVLLSDAFLRYQNRAEHVTFAFVDGHKAGKGQGGKLGPMHAKLQQ